MAMTTAFVNLVTALITPIKQSKKKLKYKKTLNALKLLMASIFEFRFKNSNSDAILFIINFKRITIKTGINFMNKSNQSLDENIRHITRMTKPTTSINM